MGFSHNGRLVQAAVHFKTEKMNTPNCPPGSSQAAATASTTGFVQSNNPDGIYKEQLIEVPVPGIAVTGQTATRFLFPDLPQLRYVYLRALKCYSFNALPVAPSTNPNISLVNFKQAFLTLYISDPDNLASQGEYIYQIPLIELNDIVDNAAPIAPYTFKVKPFIGQSVVWPKCYITFAVAPGNLVPNSVIFLCNYRGVKV